MTRTMTVTRYMTDPPPIREEAPWRTKQ